MKLQIGTKTYPSKNKAIEYYKSILNSYDFGESLCLEHFNDLIDLINYAKRLTHLSETEIIKTKKTIAHIRVVKYLYNTKCFELVSHKQETLIISYRQLINQNKTSRRSVFNSVCRNLIQSDLTKLKQDYFKKFAVNSKAKCQETNEMHFWDNLVVDHRQPNTFSVIVDRFIEVNQLEVDKIEFLHQENRLPTFADENLNKKFIQYHKDKAQLRIVRKDLNLSRTGMARIKTMKKDLKIR